MSSSKRLKDLINNTFEVSRIEDGVKVIYVDGDFISFYCKKNFGNVFTYYDNTSDLMTDFNHYNKYHSENLIRLIKALNYDYNPCNNYDRVEDTTISHTGTIGNSGSGGVTNEVSAFDSDTYVPNNKATSNSNSTTTLNNSDTTTSHITGNIGVMTVSQMLLGASGEIALRFTKICEAYINDWLLGVIVSYGNEETEIEYAVDTEYATLEQLIEVSNTVNENTTNIADLQTRVPSDTVLGGVLYHGTTGNSWKKLTSHNIDYDDNSTIYSAMGDIDTLETESTNIVDAINEVKNSSHDTTSEVLHLALNNVATYLTGEDATKIVKTGNIMTYSNVLKPTTNLTAGAWSRIAKLPNNYKPKTPYYGSCELYDTSVWFSIGLGVLADGNIYVKPYNSLTPSQRFSMTFSIGLA